MAALVVVFGATPSGLSAPEIIFVSEVAMSGFVSPVRQRVAIISSGDAVAALLWCRDPSVATEHVMLMCDAWARPLSAAVCNAEHMALLPEFARALAIMSGSDVRMMVLGTLVSAAEQRPTAIDLAEWPELVRMASAAGIDLADRLIVGTQVVYSLADMTGVPGPWPPPPDSNSAAPAASPIVR